MRLRTFIDEYYIWLFRDFCILALSKLLMKEINKMCIGLHVHVHVQ